MYRYKERQRVCERKNRGRETGLVQRKRDSDRDIDRNKKKIEGKRFIERET